jgi:hypothetical protein
VERISALTVRARSTDALIAACYVPRPDGTCVRKAVYGKTRNDVADQLAVLIAKPGRACLSPWSRGRSSASRSTGTKHVIGPRLRPSTLSSYRETLRLHVLPTLGRINLRALTLPKCERCLPTKLPMGLARAQSRLATAHCAQCSARPCGRSSSNGGRPTVGRGRGLTQRAGPHDS